MGGIVRNRLACFVRITSFLCGCIKKGIADTICRIRFCGIGRTAIRIISERIPVG